MIFRLDLLSYFALPLTGLLNGKLDRIKSRSQRLRPEPRFPIKRSRRKYFKVEGEVEFQPVASD